MWTPISLDELNAMMLSHQKEMDEKELRFWNLIKITPEKWIKENYGDEGSGFWAVGIVGSLVLWYNDIEEGFNISSYTSFGKIDEYACNQDELNFTIKGLI